MCLYNYSIERRAIISNLVSRPLFQNNDLTPHATVFGELGDISYIYTHLLIMNGFVIETLINFHRKETFRPSLRSHPQ